MKNKVLGIHHITAIAGDPKRNFEFYSKVLGLRFIKKTVNFDDPGTYHFYYGDAVGSAGTILTFFPWGDDIRPGRYGTGMATEIGYSVPTGSLEFWIRRFEQHNVRYEKPSIKFGEKYVSFLDPDGLMLELIESKSRDARVAWKTDGINAEAGLKGFHNITLTLKNVAATSTILTELFGYVLIEQEGNRYRYSTSEVENASIVDLVLEPEQKHGHVANGTVHHVAFTVKDEKELLDFRGLIAAMGFSITPRIDRKYFCSIYFREPGGTLFEIATQNPGFTIDESIENLGRDLKLPGPFEAQRQEIEAKLVKIN